MPILKLGRMFETTNTVTRKEGNVLPRLSVTTHYFIVDLLHYTSLAHYVNLRSRGSFFVENVKKLYHASLLTHDLFSCFHDFTTTLRLTPIHNSRLIPKKHTLNVPL